MPPTAFADTFYWLALAQPRDAWHAVTLQWATDHGAHRIVTTDEVLIEFLNALARAGAPARAHAVATVQDIRNDIHVAVLPQTRADFEAALLLYEARPDKSYSLTDCRSMLVMRSLSLTDVLTNDHHFAQEGFTILFPAP